MNRAARRAAAARARGRRTGYLHRITAATRSGMKATPGVHIATIEHDARCGIYRGAGCNCVPDISVSSPDGVTVIDEHGGIRKVARS